MTEGIFQLSKGQGGQARSQRRSLIEAVEDASNGALTLIEYTPGPEGGYLFDVTGIGRICLSRSDVEPFLIGLCLKLPSRRVSATEIGQIGTRSLRFVTPDGSTV